MQTIVNLRMIKKLSCSSVAVLFAAECLANSWVYVASSDNEDYFVDPTTIKRHGAYLRAWELSNFVLPNKEIKGINSSKTQYEYSCDEDMYRIIYSTEYSGHMGGGEIIHSSSFDKNFKPVVPETVGWTIFKYICNKK